MRLCHGIGEGGDNRTMGVSDVAKVDSRRFHLITAFVQDRRLHKMAAAHLGMAPRDVRVKTLAGSTAPGQSSGGGWHKDTRAPGIKALLYLDDVGPSNGPFSMLLGYDANKTLTPELQLSERLKLKFKVSPTLAKDDRQYPTRSGMVLSSVPLFSHAEPTPHRWQSGGSLAFARLK